MGHGKVSSFHIWQSFHTRNKSKTIRSDPVKESKPIHTLTTKNCHLDIPIPFTVHHNPGPMNQLASCLSRLGIQNDSIKLPKLHVNQITSQLKPRSVSLQQLHIETQEDDKLVLLKHIIMNGWLNSIKEVPHKIHPYWTFCEELTTEDRLIHKGT